MALLPALQMKEAVGGVIKLKNVPEEGATALIPQPDNNFTREYVSVFIEHQEYLLTLGVPIDGYYRVKVSKGTLTDHIGPNKQFKYMIWHDATGDLSYSISFEILRS